MSLRNSLRNDFDGLSEEYDVIDSVSSASGERSQPMPYGAADGPSPAESYIKPGFLGNVRNIRSFKRAEWAFIVIGVISFMTSLGFTIERLVHFSKNFSSSEKVFEHFCLPNNSINCIDHCHHWTCLSDFTFALILIVNLIFALFYGVDGLIRERGLELLGVLIPIVIVLFYLSANLVYHLIHIKDKDEGSFPHGELALRIVRLVTSWILGPILAVSTVALYIKMGKLMFILLDRDKRMKRIYQFSSFLSVLIFFNIQLLFNLVILAFSRDTTFLHTPEMVALPILVAYTIALSLVGWYGIWYEHKSMMVVFVTFLLPTPAYYIYKIYNVAKNYSFYDNHPYDYASHNEDISHYEYVAIFLFIISGLGLLACVLICIVTIRVIMNFGKGLKEKIPPPFSLYTCCNN
uniref:DUF7789 domain-containing protein n=2 Tax=Amphimedon queenslandica TaxID=400682 RepID=A0A1X7VAW6_AMPQE